MKKQPFCVGLVFLASLGFGACNKVEPPTPAPPAPSSYQLRVAIENTNGAASDPDTLLPLVGYYFHEGRLYKEAPLDSETPSVEITALPGSEIHFIHGLSLVDRVIVGQTTLEEFHILEVGDGGVGHEHEHSAPEFMSSSVTLPESGGVEKTILLRRGFARLDLDASTDRRMQIDKLEIVNAAGASRLVGGAQPQSPAVRKIYEHRFDTPLSGLNENLLSLYESSEPLEIMLYGAYDGVPVQVSMTLPTVHRNRIYVLRILNAGSTVNGIFEVLPWEGSTSVDGRPDLGHTIRISPDYSTFPDGVTLGADSTRVEVSNRGGRMQLAFVAATEVAVDEIAGQTSLVTITPAGPATPVRGGILTRVDVSVQAQSQGRLPYTLTLMLKSPLLQHVYDAVDISVAGSDHQIQTATLGGCDWMAFNARSRDLSDQIYPLDGASVEAMYQQNWIHTVGGLFQWGRIYCHTPWVGYPVNNPGNQSQNLPWVAVTHMPCPDGYRVPTREELRALLPVNQDFPGTYDYNGEPIDATLHTVPGVPVTPTNVGGTQRYLKLTSRATGQYLILPLAGSKGDKNPTANPQFGQRLVLWSNSNAGAVGGWAWTGQLNFGNGNTATSTNAQLQAEGYASVRCVRQ